VEGRLTPPSQADAMQFSRQQQNRRFVELVAALAPPDPR